MTRTQQIEEDCITEMENCRVIKLYAEAVKEMENYAEENGCYMQNTYYIGENA